MMFWISALVSLTAAAYIPEYSTITSRAADQHGKGAYQIEQEVTFRKDSDVYSIKETWQVLNENEMRVTLEGRGPLRGLVSGTIVYHGNSKSLADGGQNVRAIRLGEEWLEPMFYFRSSKWLRNRLVALKIAPPESIQDRPALNSEGEPRYEAPSFLRLSRTGGVVNWAVGIPPTVGIAPTAWFEQDQFVLRKIRTASQVTLKADDYAKFAENMWFPRSRTYTYGPFVVTVNTLSVKSLGKLPAGDTRFKATSLNPARDAVKLPESDALKEFYSRFR
ncbi:MAG: hypothetical protein KF799_01795 [Bdellovibrionales bacterium]|nr:hypothetical protein [Bdellovibrionales bacterium]